MKALFSPKIISIYSINFIIIKFLRLFYPILKSLGGSQALKKNLWELKKKLWAREKKGSLRRVALLGSAERSELK
jgi:hypothetical protein